MGEIKSDNTWSYSALLHKMLLVSLVGLIGLPDMVSTRRFMDTSFNLDLRVSRNSPHTECSTRIHRIRQVNAYHCGDSDRDRENEIIIKNGKATHYCTTRHGIIISTTSFEDMMKWYNNGTKAVGVPTCYEAVNLCCLVAQMGNNIYLCPEGKQLACYNGNDGRYDKKSLPLCDPPLAETGLNCKCYQSKLPLSGEEDLPECYRNVYYKECLHMKRTYDNIYRCVCSPVKRYEKLHYKSCSRL